MSAEIGRPPELRLKVKRKRDDSSSQQGAGWINEDGSITIRLDVCCVLTSDPDILITLFPIDRNKKDDK